MRVVPMLSLFFLSACTAGPTSYALLVVESDAIKTFADGELGEPIVSGVTLRGRLDAATVAAASHDEGTWYTIDSAGTVVSEITVDASLLTSWERRWARGAGMFFDFDDGGGPNIVVGVDLGSGEVTEFPRPAEAGRLLAVSDDASLSLWDLSGAAGVRLAVLDGVAPDSPVHYEFTEDQYYDLLDDGSAFFDPDGSRLFFTSTNDVNQRNSVWMDLSTGEVTEVFAWSGVGDYRNFGGTAVLLAQDSPDYILMDGTATTVWSGSNPQGQLDGISPDLQWVLWGTEMFDTAPGTFRYAMVKLSDGNVNEGDGGVDLVRDVTFSFTGAAVLE